VRLELLSYFDSSDEHFQTLTYTATPIYTQIDNLWSHIIHSFHLIRWSQTAIIIMSSETHLCSDKTEVFFFSHLSIIDDSLIHWIRERWQYPTIPVSHKQQNDSLNGSLSHFWFLFFFVFSVPLLIPLSPRSSKYLNESFVNPWWVVYPWSLNGD